MALCKLKKPMFLKLNIGKAGKYKFKLTITINNEAHWMDISHNIQCLSERITAMLKAANWRDRRDYFRQ